MSGYTCIDASRDMNWIKVNTVNKNTSHLLVILNILMIQLPTSYGSMFIVKTSTHSGDKLHDKWWQKGLRKRAYVAEIL